MTYSVVCPVTVKHPSTGSYVDGEVLLLEDRGWSVISDIDDTIKLTMVGCVLPPVSMLLLLLPSLTCTTNTHHHQVKSKSAMLRQTFLKPFKPIAGMAELYSVCCGQHLCFCNQID
jgi:hypothetical protein